MGILLGEISANIRADTSRFSADLSNAESMGNRFSRNLTNQNSNLSQSFGNVGQSVGSSFNKVGSVMESVGNSIKNVGNTLTQYITLPLIGAGVAVFNFGKNFETELSKVVGLVGVSQKQVNAWGSEILELAPKLGKAPNELAEALFYVTSAGIKGAEAMDILTMAGKGSSAGLGETKVLADLVTSAMNAYGKENLSAAKAMDIVTMAVRQGKAEASELAGSFGQVLPIASEMGVTFDQVAASIAGMTRTGTPATEAATQLKSILSGMLKPSKQAEEQLKKMGTSSAEMRKKIREDGLISALTDLRNMTNKYGEDAMAKVYPNIRGLLGVFDLMGSNAKENKKIFGEVANSTGTLDEAFKSASETLDFKWNQALSKVKTTAIGFFNVLKATMLPVLEKFISILDFVSGKFSSLSPSMQKAVMGFALVAGVIGPAMIVLGTIVATLGGIIAGLGTVITTVSGIIGTVGLPVIGAIAGVIAIVITAIGALVGSFILLWKTNEEFRNKVIEVWNSVKTNAIEIFKEIKKTVIFYFNGIKAFWKEHGETIKAYLKSVWDIILTIIKFSMEQFKNIIKLVMALMRGDWKTAFEAVKAIIRTALNYIIALLKNFKSFFGNLWNAIKALVSSIVSSMVNRIKSYFGAMYNAGKSLASSLKNAITSINFVSVGIKIVSGIISGVKKMLGALSNVASKIASTIRNKLPFSPAKEGPLKDLDKIDFYTSINKALMRAKNKVDLPSFQLGEEIMNNVSKSPTLSIGTSENANKNLSINGPMNFYGVQDTYSLMKELRSTILRYSGRI